MRPRATAQCIRSHIRTASHRSRTGVLKVAQTHPSAFALTPGAGADAGAGAGTSAGASAHGGRSARLSPRSRSCSRRREFAADFPETSVV